ncbi:alpha/beta hydrolase [Gammaproteobacteria bacterium]|nr:alpha/beta hydrolase [Gammaproteobacteria bacterium]MDC1021533.1 alpha/beta hydrolase [Gammaproteobacteria bacterium]
MDIFSTYFHNFELIDKTKKSILFIAGAGMDHRLVRSIKLSDSDYNKPLIIDLPGHGLTKGSSSNCIETYSKFLIDSLIAYDLTEISICGHSMGGLVALDMVTRQSYKATSLILVNSIYPTRVADVLLTKAKAGNGPAADFIIKYGLYRRLLGIKNAFSEKEDLVMLDDLEACNNYQLDLTELKNLELPISIILGSKDKLVDLKAVDSFANVVPSKIHTIDEVGHFPFFEDPDQLSKLISSLV